MKQIIYLIVCFVSFNVASAQSMKGEASLPKVEADGFYRIAILPGITTYLNTDFTNLRIFDKQNKEIPYLFQEEKPSYYSQVFKEYEVVEKKQIKNCCTSLILKNPNGSAINNIILSIRNAEVTKEATLLGSDDKQNWFALKQQFYISSLTNKDDVSEIKIIDFPLSNYLYYQLQLQDSTSAPVNILRADYYEATTENGKYTEVKGIKLLKADSIKQKKSYVHILFDSAAMIDKLTLSFTGTAYYLRKASLYLQKERRNRKGKTERYYALLEAFEISSKQSSVIQLSGVKVNDFLVQIENEDNPALDVASINAYQLNRYLVAYLKKGEQYKLKIGANNLSAPSYDLGFFKDNIPAEAVVITPGTISVYKEQHIKTSYTFFTSRYIIWLAIILVVIVLGFMSVRLIKETSGAKK